VRFVAQPTPDDDAGFRQRFINRLPLYLYDPQAHAAIFERHMGDSFSAWPFRMQTAVDQLPAAEQGTKLAAIRAETLILVGRHCWISPVAVSEHLHAGISESRLVVFERTGHFRGSKSMNVSSPRSRDSSATGELNFVDRPYQRIETMPAVMDLVCIYDKDGPD
jgi:hypothetical protein